ncbi:MAG: hypothetical protein Q9167_006287 [Letrouitia subvulpina]
MAGPPSAWDAPVDERIKIIRDRLSEADFAQEVPGLKEVLDDYLNENTVTTRVIFHRGLLQTFKKSQTDFTYEDLLDKYSDDEKSRLEKFVDGEDPADISKGFVMGPSLGAREEMDLLHRAERVDVSAAGPVHVDGLSSDELKKRDSLLHKFVHSLADFFHIHKEKAAVTVYKDAQFQNWGLNITNQPLYTCVPTTVEGVIRIVKFAKEQKLSVRCAGFRHSWAPIFGENGQIFISLLDLKTATHLPNTTSLPLPESKPNALESIEVVPGTARAKGNTLVRVGAAVTNERLRRWCVKNKKVTLPINVIMVEITLGGSNAPICHGSGRRHQTLSDLVRAVEYVDANGHLQTVKKPEHLRAAAGCFGLMGVVTHLVLELQPMSYADMKPEKIPIMQAVPPPPGMPDSDIPKALLVHRTPEQRAKDQEIFEKRASDDFYSEWFWFPYSDYSWVNCWSDTTDAKDVKAFPDDLHIFLSFVQTFTMNVLQMTPLLDKLINAVHLNEAAVTLISRAAMFALPEKPVKTYLTDALHFQRAIQNVRVRDIEVEMPLLSKKEDPKKVDYTLVQKAWWDAILTVYKYRETCPMRMPLEMRIMGGSDIIMAPQRGNALGTCSIEVLTLYAAREVWHGFAQEVLDTWMKLRDADPQGRKLDIRPHWAKEWKEFRVDGKPWPEVLRDQVYKDEIKEFNDTLSAIGKEHGWTREDLAKRFGNEFLVWFFFGGGKGT